MTVGGGDNYKCAPAFAMLQARLEEDGANLVKKVNGVYCFKVSAVKLQAEVL